MKKLMILAMGLVVCGMRAEEKEIDADNVINAMEGIQIFEKMQNFSSADGMLSVPRGKGSIPPFLSKQEENRCRDVLKAWAKKEMQWKVKDFLKGKEDIYHIDKNKFVALKALQQWSKSDFSCTSLAADMAEECQKAQSVIFDVSARARLKATLTSFAQSEIERNQWVLAAAKKQVDESAKG